MASRLTQTLKLFVIVLIPIFIIGGAVRLLATNTYLSFEYSKPSFPPDPFGFTQQQRFELASVNIQFVRENLPGEALSNQILDGKPVYTQREVTHMVDVQYTFQSVLRVWWAAVFLLTLTSFILWKTGERMGLALAIKSGGFLTSGIIVAIALLALFAWQFWFNSIHLLFFNPDSWLFEYSDTLIRLFPLQFWIDATLTISFFSLCGGLILALIGWLQLPRSQ